MMKTVLIKTLCLLSFIPIGLLAQEVNGSIYMTEGNPFLEADQQYVKFSVQPNMTRKVNKIIQVTNTANLAVHIDKVVFSAGSNSSFQISNIQEGMVIEGKNQVDCSISFNPSAACKVMDTLKIYFANSTKPLIIALEGVKELLVNPNPTDGKVTLQGSFYKAPLMVYDQSTGNIVLQTLVTGTNPTVNLSNLPPRVYLFKMDCVTAPVIKN